MVKCDFWELESTQKISWLNLKNVWMQKSFCLVIFTMDDLQIQMTWIQRAWIQHSQSFLAKLVSFNLVHWIDLGWFSKMGTKVCLNWNGKKFNLNNWAAREKLTGRPAKRSAPAGCLSGCPHSSVRQGVRSGMGRCGAFDLVLIQRLRVIVDVGQRRRDSSGENET